MFFFGETNVELEKSGTVNFVNDVMLSRRPSTFDFTNKLFVNASRI